MILELSDLIVSGKSFQDRLFCPFPRGIFAVSPACSKENSFGVENEKLYVLRGRDSSRILRFFLHWKMGVILRDIMGKGCLFEWLLWLRISFASYGNACYAGYFGLSSISFPELRSPWPAVGKRELWEQPFQACAIARNRCRLRLRSEADNQNSVISHCYFKMDAPRALVFRPLVKGNEALGTRLVSL